MPTLAEYKQRFQAGVGPGAASPAPAPSLSFNRLSGITPNNWTEYAADEVQRHQEERDAAGKPRMSAQEQVGVQDAFRQMVGLSPVLAGRDYLQEQLKQTSEANPALGYSRSMLSGLGQTGANVAGLFNPEAGSQLRQGMRGAYGELPVETVAGKVGGFMGQTLPSAIYMAGGPAGLALAGAVGAGGSRTDIYEAGASQAMPWWKEAAISAGHGAVELGTEAIGAGLGRMGGRVLQSFGPTVAAAYRAAGKPGISAALKNTIMPALGKAAQFEMTALGEGGEEWLAQILGNAIDMGTWDPNRTLGQGAGQAFQGGWAGQHLLGAIGAGMVQAPQQQQAPVAPPPAAGPEIYQPANVMTMLEQFAQDPEIPDAAKMSVLQQVQAAQQAGRPQGELVGIVQNAVSQIDQARWTGTPLGEQAGQQAAWQQAAPLYAGQEAPVTAPISAEIKPPSSLREEGGNLGQVPVTPGIAPQGAIIPFDEWVQDPANKIEPQALLRDPAYRHEAQRQYDNYVAQAQQEPQEAVQPPPGAAISPAPSPEPARPQVTRPRGGQAASGPLKERLRQILTPPGPTGNVVEQAAQLIERAKPATGRMVDRARARKLLQAAKSAKQEARTDELTGLGNRRAYEEAKTNLTKRHAETGKPGSVLIFDAANLKAVNEKHGYEAGNKMLADIGGLLRKSAGRQRDAVVTRQGGDEFAVFLQDTDAAGAAVVRDRIEKAVGRREIAPGVTTFLSGGIGTVSTETDISGAEVAAEMEMKARKAEAKKGRGEAATREQAMAAVEGAMSQRAEERQAPPATPRRESPRGTPDAERIYSAALQGRTKDFTPADRKVLAEANTRAGQDRLVNQVREGDLGSAMILTAANMGNIRNAAKRVLSELAAKNMNPRMTEDELVGEGAETFLMSVQGKQSLTTTGKVSEAGDIAQFDAAKGTLSTFLIGRRTLKGVGQRMYDLAVGWRPGVETKKARKGELPREVSMEGMTEKAGQAAEPAQEAAGRRGDESPEEIPLSQEGQDLVARARKMVEGGSTESEVRAWVREQAAKATEQGIMFRPDPEGRAAKIGYEVSDDIVDRVITDEANAGAGDKLRLVPVKPKTELEKGLADWARAHGIASVGFFAGEGTRGFVYWESRGRHPIKRLMLRAGSSDRAQMAATLGHEASHYTGLDQALRVTDSKLAADAIKRYVSGYEEVFGPEAARELAKNPERLAREAAATLIGDAFLDPMVRRRLQMEDATLWQKIVDSIRYAINKVRGRNEIIDQVLKGFKDLEIAPAQPSATVMYQPEAGKVPAETDVEKFHANLAKTLAEKPKQTGRPELANPMETEATRRLMDYIDEMRRASGVPAIRTDQRVRQEADRLLANPDKKAGILESVRAGKQLNDAEVVAAQDILREQADRAFKEKTLTSILEVQRTGSGYRDVGTGTARALRIRYDKIKTPLERIREFVTGGISTLPETIRKQVAELTAKGKTSEAENIRQKHGERGLAMLEEWSKHGIDIDQLTDEQARDPKVYSKIVRDLGRLQGETTAWDVIHEYRRNALMFAPLTLMRNMLGGFYGVADTFITKPLARTIQTLIGKDAGGETAAAVQAWGSRAAWMHALANAANTMIYEVPQLETQIGLHGGKTPLGVAETEIYSTAAITGEGTARMVEAAMKVFGNDGPSITKAGKAVKAMVGTSGRVVRGPQAINSAVDELFKTLHLYGEIGAHAVRIGKEAGLKVGTAGMSRFVDEQVANTGSQAWTAAVESGESWRTAFQGEASRIERFILDATSGEYGTIGQLLRLLVPFRKTPVQITGQALMHAPGLGLGRMAQRAMQARQGGKAYTTEEFSRHAAQQLIGFLGLGIMWNLVGDDDDDKDNKIKITGPASYSRQERQERVTREQAEPYMAVRIGDQWYNYNYVEPLSQWVGTLASVVSELKRGAKTGKPSETATRLWRRLGGMYADQTYLRSLGDLAKMVYDYETFTTERSVVNFAGSWLPNIVDTSLRDADPYIRERRVGGEEGERPGLGEQVVRETFPTGNLLPPPKVDFFGNDIQVPGQKGNPATMFALRLLSPIQPRQTLEGKQGDIIRMLINWNADKAGDDPSARWFQEPSRKVQIRYPGKAKPVQEDVSDDEYYLMAKLSGILAARMVESRTWNVEKPTERDILVLEEIFTGAREEARTLLRAARQAKALGRMDRYNEIIADIKTRIPLSEQGIKK